MKTRFLAIAAVAALLAVSCETKHDSEVAVNFMAQAPEDVVTKAFSDGYTATVLYYAVYAEDGKEVLISGETGFTDRKATVPLTLVREKTYDIIFWAQNPSAPYFFDMGKQTVTATYKDISANNEVLDAFYYTVDSYKVTGPVAEPVQLRRPFAQINVGTNDTAAANTAGYIAKETDMTVASVPNVLKLHDGTVEGGAEVAFVRDAIPSEENGKLDISGTEYDYLAMNYILAPKDKVTTTVAFKIYDVNDITIPFSITNVPVQRNYKTNIYGSLLTNPTEWKVEINPDYSTPDYNEEQ